jgi:hypothetical protein
VSLSAVFRQVCTVLLFIVVLAVRSLFDHNILIIILTLSYLSIYHLDSIPFP